QPLYVPQRIDAVAEGAANDRVVGHRDDGIGPGSGRRRREGRGPDRDAVDCERVVLEPRGEHRRVEGVRGRVEQLTNDLKLIGRVLPGQHRRDEVDHTVGTGQLDVMVGLAAYADAHVEPRIAVDQVVTALPHDDVAAFATEDDVAGTEAGDHRGRR